jgi:hypothetical protein
MGMLTREVSSSGLNDGDIPSSVDLTEVKVQSCAAWIRRSAPLPDNAAPRSPAPRIDLRSLPPVALVLNPQDVNRAGWALL